MTTGQGGMITTNSENLFEKIKSLKNLAEIIQIPSEIQKPFVL